MGDVLAFSAGNKASWIEEIASDSRLTDFDVRVMVAIGRAIDRSTGEARISQEKLAVYCCGTERGLRNSIKKCIALKYLEIIYGGEQPMAVGRGHVAIYKPIKRRNSGSAFTTASDPERGNGGSAFMSPERRNGEAQKGERHDTKGGTAVPTNPIYVPRSDPIRHSGRVDLGRFEQLVAKQLCIHHDTLIERCDATTLSVLHRRFQKGEDIMNEINELGLVIVQATINAELVGPKKRATDEVRQRSGGRRVSPITHAIDGLIEELEEKIALKARTVVS